MISKASIAETIIISLVLQLEKEEILYILALSFQLTAGVLLLLGNMAISKKRLVSKYCTQHRAIRVYPNGDLKDYDEFIEVAKNNWMNQIAFLLLFLGYLLSIFGEATNNRWHAFIWVLLLTLCMLLLFNWMTSFIAKKYGNINFNQYILNKGAMAIEVPEDREGKQ